MLKWFKYIYLKEEWNKKKHENQIGWVCDWILRNQMCKTANLLKATAMDNG